MLREKELDDREIEIELHSMLMGVEIMAPPGHGGNAATSNLQSMFANLGGNRTQYAQGAY